MNNISLHIGTTHYDCKLPTSWDELTQEQFVYAVSHQPADQDAVPYKIVRHLLALPYDADLFVLPADLYVIYRDCLSFLADPTQISSWLINDIQLSDGRHCLPPAADFDNVTWEEFIFFDQLAQRSNWPAVASCLFRPLLDVPDENADPRVPFSRQGTSRRLPLFRQLDPAVLYAVQVNYLILRSHLTDRYRHLFCQDNSQPPSSSSSSWVTISRSLLGGSVWHEQQLLHTSVAQVLYHLDNTIKDSKNK